MVEGERIIVFVFLSIVRAQETHKNGVPPLMRLTAKYRSWALKIQIEPEKHPSGDVGTNPNACSAAEPANNARGAAPPS